MSSYLINAMFGEGTISISNLSIAINLGIFFFPVTVPEMESPLSGPCPLTVIRLT